MYMYINIQIYTDVWCMYVCMHACMHACMYIYIYTYIHIYINQFPAQALLFHLRSSFVASLTSNQLPAQALLFHLRCEGCPSPAVHCSLHQKLVFLPYFPRASPCSLVSAVWKSLSHVVGGMAAFKKRRAWSRTWGKTEASCWIRNFASWGKCSVKVVYITSWM